MKCILIKAGVVLVLALVLALWNSLDPDLSPYADPGVPSVRLQTVTVETLHDDVQKAINPTTTPTPTLTPNDGPGMSSAVLWEMRMHMLGLINAERRDHGLVEVVLDDNPTAQRHAEDARANCFLGHWGSDGTKPYMRYTLNRGIHSVAENVIGSSYCPKDRHGDSGPDPMFEVTRAHEELMNSPEHRQTILNPSFRKVGIGLSYEHPTLWTVQLFTTDHIKFVVTPRINYGDLTFAYRLADELSDGENQTTAAVFYDPLPQDVAAGQIAQTGCVGLGRTVAGIRPPVALGSFRTDLWSDGLSNICPDPFQIATDAQPPSSYADRGLKIGDRSAQFVPVPWLTADVEPLRGGGYRLTTDLSDQINHHGPGVYTLVIWSHIDEEWVPVSQYSIFQKSVQPKVAPTVETEVVVVRVTATSLFQSTVAPEPESGTTPAAAPTYTSMALPTRGPVPTETPTTPPEPTHTLKSALPPTALPTAKVTPSPLPVPTAKPTLPPDPTATPTAPTPSGLYIDQLNELRTLMLDLINAERRSHGLVDVVLDENSTAQMHAEDERANCFSGHWGSNGTKPYMRYTINGGTHNSAENVVGSDYCPSTPSRYRRDPLEDKVIESHDELMGSPGHRETILNPTWRKVGIGLSFEHPNLWAVQLFTTDHIEFTTMPSIEGGVLIFAYRLVNGAREGTDYPPSAAVFYDAPLRDLTRGQLTATGCVSLGSRIAQIRPSAPANSYWARNEFNAQHVYCKDPYAVDADSATPKGYLLASLNHVANTLGADSKVTKTITVPWVTSFVQPLQGGGYRVETDISAQIARNGPGVYTLVIWADINGVSAQVAEYSIFLETTQ